MSLALFEVYNRSVFFNWTFCTVYLSSFSFQHKKKERKGERCKKIQLKRIKLICVFYLTCLFISKFNQWHKECFFLLDCLRSNSKLLEILRAEWCRNTSSRGFSRFRALPVREELRRIRVVIVATIRHVVDIFLRIRAMTLVRIVSIQFLQDNQDWLRAAAHA